MSSGHRSPRLRPRLLAGAGAVCCAALAAASASAPVPRPGPPSPAETLAAAVHTLLTGRCLSCHGAAGTSGLDLRTRASALRGGRRGPGLVPGKPDESRIYLVSAGKGEVKMPPAGSLSAEEQDLLKRWIAAGAPFPKDEVRRMKDEVPESGRLHPSSLILHPSEHPSEPSEPGWALRDLRRPAVPAVRNRAWVRNPIDAFVLARLEANGLRPAPPADRRTLVRRLSFDLTGLPPTPEEVERFLQESAQEDVTRRLHSATKRRSPTTIPEAVRGLSDNHQPSTIAPHGTAYERLVDRYLASPQYGERWGRHWLDVARFAESQGFERDKIRENSWRYRDWVIQALNQDLPYDRFVREQIAGDLLGPPGEGIVATGFLVAGPWDEVGNQQVSLPMRTRVREDELEDMVSATCQTFLGLTVNCARCHDHKFDPIPQRDYYRIQAALAGVRHGDRSLLTPAEEGARSAALQAANGKAAELDRQIAAVEAEGRRRAAERKQAGPLPTVMTPPIARWTFEGDARDSVGGLHLTLSGGASLANGRLRLNGVDGQARSGPLPFDLREKTLEAWVDLPALDQGGGSALTVEDAAGQSFDAVVFGERQPRKWTAGSESFIRTRDLEAPEESAPPGALIHVAITYAADGRIAVYRNGAPYGESYQPPSAGGSALRGYAAGASHVLIGLRHSAAAAPGARSWLKGEIEEARLYNRALEPAEVQTSFRSGPPVVTDTEAVAALTPEESAARETLRADLAWARQETARLAVPPMAYAANPQPPPPVFVLKRGDITQKLDPVTPGGLSCVHQLSPDFGLAADATDAERRRKLAEWITDPRNPLTPRVLVNRVWQYHFGRGLAASSSDFGVNGEPPSHPELLDWLACTFTAPAASQPGRVGVWKYGSMGGALPHNHQPSTITPPPPYSHTPTQGLAWSLKRLHRLILLSNTYQQASRVPNPQLIDSEDRLLWRMPARRLEAEEIRDAMLSVSGQLNLRAGGPGFRPFDVFVNNSSFYTYQDKLGPEFNRRSIYRTVVNSGGIPLLETFDCPDPSTKTPRRGSTTTPLQALSLLNNSFVLRQARELAARLERDAGPEPRRQVDRAYRLAFGRPPSAAESARDAAFVKQYGLAPYCRVLFNTSEFVYAR